MIDTRDKENGVTAPHMYKFKIVGVYGEFLVIDFGPLPRILGRLVRPPPSPNSGSDH